VSDPASWLVVEKGWSVTAADGTDVGKVEGIVGDTGKDIFNGLTIATGMFSRAKYVPAENVTEIVEGTVRLDLTVEQIEELGEHEDVDAAQVRADTTDIRPAD
jgi:hypothetical protein